MYDIPTFYQFGDDVCCLLAWFFLHRILSLSNPKCTKVNWTTLRNPFSEISFYTLVLRKIFFFALFPISFLQNALTSLKK